MSDLDPAGRRLLEEIHDALAGIADWRVIAAAAAAKDALDGDPGAAADWLHEFIGTRRAKGLDGTS